MVDEGPPLADRFAPEDRPRVRRVCTTHGPVPRSPCPECGDETYDLTRPEDFAFVRDYVRRRRISRHMRAGIAGVVVGVVVYFVDQSSTALYVLTATVVTALIEWLMYRRLSVRQRWVERQVHSLERGRLLLSTPCAAILLVTLVFLITKERGSVGSFAAPSVDQISDWALAWALVPAQIVAGEDLPTLVTHALLHASWAHLLANALGLVFFGVVVDLRVGRLRCALILLVGIVAGGLAHALGSAGSELPMVGISGGVYALAGAQLALMPRRQLPVGGTGLRLPNAVVILVLVLGFGTVESFLRPELAWLGHLGGFIGGLLMGLILRRRPPPQDFLDAEAEREAMLPSG